VTETARPLHPLRRAIDWGELAPLRLRARQVAEGVYAGMHRSARRGAGVEFGGYREYVPGDDLRWLDRRSLLRHERLVVRQFETETDRALCLLVDASASMGFRGKRAPGAKLAYAGVLGAALTRVALASGDPVSLAFLGGGEHSDPIPRSVGREQFERIVGALEAVTPAGDATVDAAMLERGMQSLARATRRGAIVVMLSDLIDLPREAADRIGAIATQGRVLVVVQTLDPDEVDFPYTGNVRLRSLEGGAVVETDADTVRDRYLEAMEGVTSTWRDAVVRRGGRFLRASTGDGAVDVVRKIVEAVR
jgi:uncharacterized protein (DUF58 family)